MAAYFEVLLVALIEFALDSTTFTGTQIRWKSAQLLSYAAVALWKHRAYLENLCRPSLDQEFRMASDDKPPKIVIIPPCYLIFDKAWFCVTPMSQISHIYKTGEAEDCTEFLTDWTLCMQAKGYYKPADKQVSLICHMELLFKPTSVLKMPIQEMLKRFTSNSHNLIAALLCMTENHEQGEYL